eukprot:991924-Heterocapsa_arctica.AAC.1
MQGTVQGPLLFRGTIDRALEQWVNEDDTPEGCCSLSAVYWDQNDVRHEVPCDLSAFADDITRAVVSKHPRFVSGAMRK